VLYKIHIVTFIYYLMCFIKYILIESWFAITKMKITVGIFMLQNSLIMKQFNFNFCLHTLKFNIYFCAACSN